MYYGIDLRTKDVGPKLEEGKFRCNCDGSIFVLRIK